MQSGIKAEFVRASTLLDIARLAGSQENGFLYSMDHKDGHRLVFPAERTGKSMVLLYFDSDTIDNYGMYTREKDRFEFASSASEADELQTRKLRIIELEGNPFSAPVKDEVDMLKLKRWEDLAKGLVYRGIAEEMTQVAYRFDSNDKGIACALNAIDRDMQVLSFAETEKGKQFSFFRYNYTQDRVTQELSVARNTDFYVPVINLAEPFRFFHMPE